MTEHADRASATAGADAGQRPGDGRVAAAGRTGLPAELPGGFDDQPFGPDEHKALRRALGIDRVEDLLALSKNNDPFYAGTRSDWRDARWHADLCAEHGAHGTHLRRLHYRLLSVEGLRLPDGGPYENTTGCWQALNEAAKSARNLGLVDPEQLEDRRATPARLNVTVRDGDPQPDAFVPDPAGWARR